MPSIQLWFGCPLEFSFFELFNGEIFFNQLSGSTLIFVTNTNQKSANLMFRLISPVAKTPAWFLEGQFKYSMGFGINLCQGAKATQRGETWYYKWMGLMTSGQGSTVLLREVIQVIRTM